MNTYNTTNECDNVNMFGRNFEAIIPLVYGIPAIIFYVKIILLVINTKRKPEFATSFYRLFVISGIVNIIHWLLYYVTLRMPRAPCFVEFFSIWPRKGISIMLLLFCSFYFFYVHLVVFLLITLNRFTFIVFPSKAVAFWRHLTKFHPLTILLLPLLFSWHILLNKPRLVTITRDCQMDGYTFQVTEKRFGLRNSLYMLILAVVGAIFEVVMNTAVLMVLYNRPKLKAENSMRTVEIKLFAFTLLIFIWQMVFVVLQIFFYIDGLYDLDIVWTLFGIQQYIVDLMSLTPPFFLVIMSSDVQKSLKKSLTPTPFNSIIRRASDKDNNLSNGTNEHLISRQ